MKVPPKPSPAPSSRPTWHHVIQRGAARRPVFAAKEDIHELFQRLRLAAHHGPLEVHAYSVLTTHCHLLVRCPASELSGAIRDVFAPLARGINRRLRREGPLFAGRGYVSPVTSIGHWRSAIAYIDRNALEARLARRASLYPFSSAWHYAKRIGPPWLRRDVVEAFVRHQVGRTRYEPDDYDTVFGSETGSLAAVAARRADVAAPQLDPLDDLIGAAPADVRRWLERRAKLADGEAAGPVLAAPDAILAALREERARPGARMPSFTDSSRPGRRVDPWRVLAAGLLRSASGLSLEEIATRLEISTSGAHQQVQRHVRMIREEADYASRAERVLTSALERTFGD